MPRYQFTGFDEMVLMGLSHGVNAELHRDGHGQPDGSTVVALPGDEITTSEPYPHAWMVNTDTGSPDWPRPTFIGEQGPELIRVPDGVVVHSAERTAAAAAAGDLPNLVKPLKPRKPRQPRQPRQPNTQSLPPADPAQNTNPLGEE